MKHPMTPDEHVASILCGVEYDVWKKYRAGQKEHGGNLWRKPIVDFIGEEIIDMMVYWYTFIWQWAQLHAMVYNLYFDVDLPASLQPKVGAMLNLMDEGNAEGVPEEELNG